jgi:O-antigen ligase
MRPTRSRLPLALATLAGWSLFAFAGAYRWTLVPLIGGAALLAAAARPRIARHPHRAVDLGLLACLVATALQLVPLPAPVRTTLSPASPAAIDALVVHPDPGAPARPLSLDPAATGWALATGLALVLLFWSARAIFDRGELRRVVRGVCLFGLALAAVAFVQRVETPHLIYGFWAPVTRTAVPTPYGPFVNRNDFAAWLVLAAPLVAGYAVTRLEARWRGRTGVSLFGALESSLDAWTAATSASVALMIAALAWSLSRSGLAGAAAAATAFVALSRLRVGTRSTLALSAAGLAAAAIALQYANLSALAFRLGDSLPADLEGRVAIWRTTWPMARDFLGVGIGLGAFERGMLVYQQGSRELFFNHAHNEYLQIAAEGGLLVGVPMAWTAAAACRQAGRALLADRSSAFWMRAGAVCAVLGVAIQSLGDTGLRMPANAVLFAIVAALALHDGRIPGGRHDRPGHDTPTAAAPRRNG